MNPSENLFNEIGKTYEYEYSGVSEIELDNGDKSQVTIRAQADIMTTSACEHLLQLRNVEIQGPAVNVGQIGQSLSERLQRMPVRFVQDGRRIRQLAHHPEEDQTSLNIKRAIISALQVSSFDTISTVEKDAMGRCDTTYKLINNNNEQQVQLTKEKKLRTCSERRHPLSDLLWDVQSNGRSLSEITVDLQQRVIKQVTAEEQSTVVPLQKTTAATELKSKIMLKHVDTRMTRPDQMSNIKWDVYIAGDLAFQKPLDLYKFVQSVEQQQQLQKQTMELLYQIRQHKATAEAAQQMNELADLVAKLNAESLQTIADKLYKSKQQSTVDKRLQRMFTDVVAQSGSDAALVVMFEKALETEQPLRRWYWLAHLSTVRQARPETIQQLTALLRNRLPLHPQRQLPRQAVLSIGKIVANSNVRVEQPKVWLDAVNVIHEWFIKAEQQQQPEQERLQIAAALALKSTGMTEQIAYELMQSIQKSQSIELQLAAIDAIGAQENLVSDKIAGQLYDFYAQQHDQQQVDLHIHTFRALMYHPQQAQKVLASLDKETNEQVRFYIGSYLNNVKVHHMQSDLPAEVQQVIQHFTIPESFFAKGDKKSSRQIQLSRQFDLLQALLELDSDLIYDQDQRLAEVRVKLNVDKHYQTGEQVEIIVRQHGLDRFAEMIVQRLQDVSFKQVMQQIYELIRLGRSHELQQAVQQLLAEFAHQGKYGQQMYVSIQIAHNDQPMVFVTSQDLAQMMVEGKSTTDSIKDMLTDWTSDVSFHSFLLRKQHLLPTVSGIPLRTQVQSSLVAAIQIDSTHFHPSISYDARVKTGFYLPTSPAYVAYQVQMQSSPAFTYKLERDSNGVPSKFLINMEQSQLTLFRIHTGIEYRSFSGETKQVQLPSRQTRHCLNSLEIFFGVRLCVESTNPKQSVGPFDLHVYMQKEDMEMTGWQFSVRAPARYHPLARLEQRLAAAHNKNDEPIMYSISYSTPNSRQSRDHTFEVEMANQPAVKVIKVNLQSPFTQFKVEGRLESNDKRHAVKAELTLNKQQALVEAALTREDVEEGKYKAMLTIRFPGMRSINLSGHALSKTKGKKDVIQIKLMDDISQQSIFALNVMRTGRLFTSQYQWAVDGHFMPSQQYAYRYVNHFNMNNNQVEFEHMYSQQFGRAVPQVYRVAGKMHRGTPETMLTTEAKPYKYHAHFEYELPTAVGDLTWNMNERLNRFNQQPLLESELSVFFARNKNEAKRRVLYMTQALKGEKVKNDKQQMLSMHFTVQSEPLNIEHELEARVQYQPTHYHHLSLNLGLLGKSGRKIVRATLDYDYRPQDERMLRIESRLDLDFGRPTQYKWKHETDRKQNRLISSNTVQWADNRQVEWSTTYNREVGRELTEYILEGQVRVPHANIDYAVQNVVRMSTNFELKSLFRENKQTHSEARLFLSRTEQSSLYVDNRFVNIRLETNLIDRNLKLSINGKTTGFSHDTRYDQTGEQFELVSKTSGPTGHWLDMRVKYNDTNAIVIVEPIRQKFNLHFDRMSRTLVMFVKHDQLFATQHTHQLQAIVAMPSPTLITVEAKFDQDQSPLAKLRAKWDSKQEATFEMAFQDFRVHLETRNGKQEINAIVHYAPTGFKTDIQLKRTSRWVIDGLVKVTMNQRSTEGKLRLDWQGESKFVYENHRHQIEMITNVPKMTSRTRVVDKQTQKSYDVSAYMEDAHTLTVKYELRNGHTLMHSNQWQVRSQMRRQNGQDYELMRLWNVEFPALVVFSVKDDKQMLDHQTKMEISWNPFFWESTRFEMQSKTAAYGQKYQFGHKVKVTRNQFEMELTTWNHQKYIAAAEYSQLKKEIIVERQSMTPGQDERLHRVHMSVQANQVMFDFDQKAEGKQDKMAKLQLKFDSLGTELDVKLAGVETHFEFHSRHHHQQQKHMLIKVKLPTYRHTYEQSLEWTSAQDYKSGTVDLMMSSDQEELIKFVNKYNYEYMQTWYWTGEVQVRRQSQIKVELNLNANRKSTVVGQAWNNDLVMTFDTSVPEFEMKVKVPKFNHKSTIQMNKNEFNLDVYVHSKSIAGLKYKNNKLEAHLYEYVAKVEFSRHLMTNKRIMNLQLNNLDKNWEAQLFVEHTGLKHIEYELMIKHLTKTWAHLNAKVQFPTYVKQQISYQTIQTTFEAKLHEFVRFVHLHAKREMLAIEATGPQHQQDNMYALIVRMYNEHKLQTQVKLSQHVGQIKDVTLTYDHLPSQLHWTGHVTVPAVSTYKGDVTFDLEMSRVQQRVYQMEGSLNVKTGDFEFVFKQKVNQPTEVRVAFQSIAKILTAHVLSANGKQFELKIEKPVHLNVYTRVHSDLLVMTLKLNQDAHNFHLFIDAESRPWELVHKTEVTTTVYKYVIKTKTESKHFAYLVDAVYQPTKSNRIEFNYRLLKYTGQGKWDYVPMKHLQISGEYVRKTSTQYTPLRFDATVQLNQHPYQGKGSLTLGQQQYDVDIKTEQQSLEAGHYHTELVARHVNTGKQFFIAHLFTASDSLHLKTDVLGKHYELKFVSYSQQFKVYGHELSVVYDQMPYGYVVKYELANSAEQPQKGLIQVTLPDQMIEFNTQIQYDDYRVFKYVAQFYPNKKQSDSNVYGVALRFRLPAYEMDKIEGQAKLELSHSSLTKPIAFDLQFHYDPHQEKPIVVRFAVDSSESYEPVVASFEMIHSIPKKAVTFKLYQSQSKHVQLTAEWNLRLPYHHQSLTWQYNNGFKRPVEGGYVFNGNFERHHYELELKSINRFVVDVSETANKAKYTVDVQLAHGHTKQIILDLYLNHHYSHLNVFDREGRKYSYTGSVDYSLHNGLHIQLHDSDSKRQIVNLYVKRDEQSFVKVEAKVEREVRALLQPSQGFVQSLDEYTHTRQQMQEILQSLGQEMVGSRFYKLVQLISRDMYNLLAKVLPMETIENIISQLPQTSNEFVRALSEIVHYYQGIVSDFIHNHFHPSLIYNLNMFDVLIRQLNDFWYDFQKSIPVYQIKRFVQSTIDMVTYTQQMFDDHVKQFLDLAIEHTKGMSWVQNWLVRMEEAIPQWGHYVLSLNLAEIVTNALEIITGRPIWLKGNELTYTPEEGVFKMCFFLPKHIFHNFE